MGLNVSELRAYFTVDTSQIDKAQANIRRDGQKSATELTKAYDNASRASGQSIDRNILTAVRGTGQKAGSLISDGLGRAGWLGIGGTIGAGLVAGIGGEITAADLKGRLQAQLGATGGDATRYGKVAGSLYAQAWGDSATDVGASVRAVVANIGGMRHASAKELQAVTADVLGISSAFDEDGNAITRAANKIVTTGMAKNVKQAMDVLAVGFQHNENEAGDLLDTFTEYPTEFRKLGLSGADAMGLIRQGLKGGARDSDIVADALKEISIRAVDGSKTTAQGFALLGLNGQLMADRFAKGGDTAKKALTDTLDGLRAIPDPVRRSQAAVDLFGTQAEDLGQALYKLHPETAARGLGKIGDAAKGVGDSLNSPSARVTAFKRTLQKDLVGFIDSEVIPMGEKAGEIKGWFDGLPKPAHETAKWVGIIAGGLGTSLYAAKKLKDVISVLSEGKDAISGGLGKAAGKTVGKELGNVAGRGVVPVFVTNKGFGGGAGFGPAAEAGEAAGGGAVAGAGLAGMAVLGPLLQAVSGGPIDKYERQNNLPRTTNMGGGPVASTNLETGMWLIKDRDKQLASLKSVYDVVKGISGVKLDKSNSILGLQFDGDKVKTYSQALGNVDDKLATMATRHPDRVLQAVQDVSSRTGMSMAQLVRLFPEASQALGGFQDSSRGGARALGDLLGVTDDLTSKTVTFKGVLRGFPNPKPKVDLNTQSADAKRKALRDQLNAMTGHQWTINVGASVGAAVAAIAGVQGRLNNLHAGNGGGAGADPAGRSSLPSAGRTVGDYQSANRIIAGGRKPRGGTPAMSMAQLLATYGAGALPIATDGETSAQQLADYLSNVQQQKEINAQLKATQMVGKKGHKHREFVAQGVDRQLLYQQLQALKDTAKQAATAAQETTGDAAVTASTQVADATKSMNSVFGGSARPTTAAGLARQLAKSGTQEQTFSTILAQLQGKLSKDLLDQFFGEGPSAAAIKLGQSILATGNFGQLNGLQAAVSGGADAINGQSLGTSGPAAMVNIEQFNANDMSVGEIAERLYYKSLART